MKEAIIYHIANRFDWEKSKTDYIHPSLDKEGFIHCSAGHQVYTTYEKYYQNSPTPLLLLEIDCLAVGEHLRWEYATERGQEFPHIYAPIARSWVLDYYNFTPELARKFAPHHKG